MALPELRVQILSPWTAEGPDHVVEAWDEASDAAVRWYCTSDVQATALHVELLGLRWRREICSLEQLVSATSRPPAVRRIGRPI
jgi:hypothetical protein